MPVAPTLPISSLSTKRQHASKLRVLSTSSIAQRERDKHTHGHPVRMPMHHAAVQIHNHVQRLPERSPVSADKKIFLFHLIILFQQDIQYICLDSLLLLSTSRLSSCLDRNDFRSARPASPPRRPVDAFFSLVGFAAKMDQQSLLTHENRIIFLITNADM